MDWRKNIDEWLTSEENRVSSVELEILTDEDAFSVSWSLFVSLGGRKRQKTFVTIQNDWLSMDISRVLLQQDNLHRLPINLANQNVFSSLAFVKPYWYPKQYFKHRMNSFPYSLIELNTKQHFHWLIRTKSKTPYLNLTRTLWHRLKWRKNNKQKHLKLTKKSISIIWNIRFTKSGKRQMSLLIILQPNAYHKCIT